MISERSIVTAARAVVFLLLYGLAASTLGPSSTPYLPAVAGLLVTLAAFAAADLLPALRRGESPSFGDGSALHAVRGPALLIAFVLLTAATADGLRAATGLSETVLTLLAFLVASALVFGPVVGYHWRRSLD